MGLIRFYFYGSRAGQKKSFLSFKVFTDSKLVLADSVVVATGTIAKRLSFPGSGEGPSGFWNRKIPACVVCDGAAPIFRNKPLTVIGDGEKQRSLG